MAHSFSSDLKSVMAVTKPNEFKSSDKLPIPAKVFLLNNLHS